MSIKRSAVTQVNVKMSIKSTKKEGGKIRNQGIYQKVQTLHYATVKKINAGALK